MKQSKLPDPAFTENAIVVLQDRYLAKNEKGELVETPKDMLIRVAKAVARVEKPEEVERRTKEFYEIMAKGWFMPNSPCLMNAGRNDEGAYSACFVLPLEDSIADIFDTVKATAQVQKAGGGTGFSFDKLRPTGDYIKSSGGTTSGPISFWKVLSEATNAIQQGAFRRGANMGMMSINHPDILKFLTAKQDLSKFNNYNISVKVSDEWMEEYKKNPNSIHLVKNFRTGKEYVIPKEISGEKIATYALQDLYEHSENNTYAEGKFWTKGDVFQIIRRCAWNTGEPGLIFIDKVNIKNPTPHVGDIEATNPCVTGDTPILTDKGYFRIDSLVGQKVNVWNGFEWSEVEPRVTGENQKIMLVKFSDGSELKVTPYHNFLIQNGQKRDKKDPLRIKAKDLKGGDRVAYFEYPVLSGGKTESRALAYTRGFFCGDGSHHTKRDRDSLWLYGEKVQLLEHFAYKYANECAGGRVHVELDGSHKWEKSFVPGVEWDVSTRMDWLAGLIDSDGSVTMDGGVQIWSTNKGFLQNVKEMLFFSGAYSALSLGKAACTREMPDGHGGKKEYLCQDTYRLGIPLWAVNVLKGQGLVCERVDISKEAKIRIDKLHVVSVEDVEGVEDKVYCFTEDKRHAGTFGCIVGGQCGEQPLLPYESCNLGSINVAACVKEDGTFDWDLLKDIVASATRFLDDVVDASPYPIPQITEMCHNNRKIGLGLMGFANALFLMKIPYNSKEGVEFGKKLMLTINESSEHTSEMLAKEKGVFPNWKGSRWELEWGNRPMRNSVCTTVAPTGTISILADCSGGIEPLFSLVFFRNVLNGKSLMEVSPIFEKVAKERGFHSEELVKHILEKGTIQDFPGIPEDVKKVFVCAQDISPKWHILMQAAFQENCGSSISKTVNMPNHATEDEVEEAYMLAYASGCKGVTVYRDGCRTNQPMALSTSQEKHEGKESKKEEAPREYQERKPLKTPAILSSVRLRQNTPHGNMHVNISMDPRNERDYEVFAQLGKAGDIMASDLEAICRLASLYLRLGGTLYDIQEQLLGIGSNVSIPTKSGKVSSLADGLGHAIKNYLTAKGENGLKDLLLGNYTIQETSTKKSAISIVTVPQKSDTPKSSPKAGTKCPGCGVGVLIRTEGCTSCSIGCGYSKCG